MTQGCRYAPTAGLELANAFGVKPQTSQRLRRICFRLLNLKKSFAVANLLIFFNAARVTQDQTAIRLTNESLPLSYALPFGAYPGQHRKDLTDRRRHRHRHIVPG